MNSLKNNIFLHFLALGVALVLLAPPVVKTIHSFINHEHLQCDTQSDTHIHDKELECKFDKFQLNKQFFGSLLYIPELVVFNKPDSPITREYFVTQSQFQSYSLRAPPIFIFS